MKNTGMRIRRINLVTMKRQVEYILHEYISKLIRLIELIVFNLCLIDCRIGQCIMLKSPCCVNIHSQLCIPKVKVGNTALRNFSQE